MRFLGIISLLITVAIAGWWLSASLGPSDSESKVGETPSYQDSIDSARDAAVLIESR